MPIVAPLPSPPGGWFDFSYSLFRDGTLGVIRTDHDVQRDKSRIPPNTRAVLSRFNGQTERRVMEYSLAEYSDVCDQLTNGEWIARSGGYSDLCIVSPEGRFIRRFELGPGAGHIQSDASGAIWVGYFDYADGENYGVIKFDDHGRLLWRADKAEPDEPDIFDCYALNVSGDKTWAYYYVDFPILEVDGRGRTRLRACDITGADAIAVDRQYALLAGGYGEEQSRIALLELRGDKARVVEQFRAEPIARSNFEWPWLLAGRADAIHAVHEGVWHRIRVSEVCAQLGLSATTVE